MSFFTKPFTIEASSIEVGDVILRAIDSERDYNWPKTITKVFDIEGKMIVFHYEDEDEKQSNNDTGKCFACKIDARGVIIRKITNILKKL